MTAGRPHTEKTSAADKSAGFDFQYYYFLWRLLNLSTGESVGLEVMDDVHTELANSRQILIQLKHTTQEKADGSTKNLATLDPDFWKSLSNWSQVISDSNANRQSEGDQLNFVNRTDFLLATNKSDNESNTVISAINDLKTGMKSYSELKIDISSLSQKTTDSNIKKYISNVLSLSDSVGEAFFRNIQFDLGCDDIINKCKISIKEYMIEEHKIDDVFSKIDSKLRADIFISARKKEKVLVSWDDVYKKFRAYFDRARSHGLIIKKFSGEMPDNLENQKFIQQLIDIEDIPRDDIESMAQFTRHLLQMRNNIDEWYKNGDLTQHEIDDFKAEAQAKWKNEFRKAYRGNCSDQEIAKRACDLIDSLRKETLPLASQNMPTEMSNGQFYHLSDVPEIGWHKDWEGKYKK